ncbi:hypothetical protein AUK04_03305 [Candidatus Roizmanbacteria bacterium CG2_30_33_16]|uniref:tRNA dimethylallyltransferase n=6 Tax=Candidatus Roizmaniibacteriota TaxID=1752723 RepID=A0A2M7E348_9BACT
MRNIIVVTGQTATGKTKLALQLAKKHNGEIINCDSRQIYKDLNIITGKDIDVKSKFTLNQKIGEFNIGYFPISFKPISNNPLSNNPLIPSYTRIWLYDIVDSKIPFSSYNWTTCANIAIKDIFKRGKTPIIIGGTYLYLKHLLYGFETEKIPPDWKLRKLLNKYPVIKLQNELIKVDPDIFKKLNQSDVANPQRLIRKIEIAFYYKKKSKVDATFTLLSSRANEMSVAIPTNYSNPSNLYGIASPAKRVRNDMFMLHTKLDESTILSSDLSFNFIGLKFKEKNDLIKAITKRVHERIKQGAVDEVKFLLNKGYLPTDPGLKTIGYSQLIDHIFKKVTLKEAINAWIIRETQYAKRQYTFMKKDPNIHWRMI